MVHECWKKLHIAGLDKSRFSVMLQIDRLVEQVSTGPRWLGTMFSMLWWHRKREERVALIEN